MTTTDDYKKNHIIVWKFITTGHSGRGSTRYSKTVAEAICRVDNAANSDVFHWAEKVEV